MIVTPLPFASSKVEKLVSDNRFSTSLGMNGEGEGCA